MRAVTAGDYSRGMAAAFIFSEIHMSWNGHPTLCFRHSGVGCPSPQSLLASPGTWVWEHPWLCLSPVWALILSSVKWEDSCRAGERIRSANQVWAPLPASSTWVWKVSKTGWNFPCSYTAAQDFSGLSAQQMALYSAKNDCFTGVLQRVEECGGRARGGEDVESKERGWTLVKLTLILF